MKRAARFVALAAVGLCLFCEYVRADQVRQQPRIGDLMIVPLDVQITKENGRSKAPPGFHYVRFTVSVKNVGHKAICTYLSANLDSTLNVKGRTGSWKLKARNGADTAWGGSIHQLLPGEELDGTIVFGDLRDGLEPVTLTVASQGQGCGSTERSGESGHPLTFAIRDSSYHPRVSLVTRNLAGQPVDAHDSEALSSPQPQDAETKPTILVSAPKALYAPDAAYTDAARRAKLNGKVSLHVLVGKDGLVHDVEALNQLGMGLDEQAVATVRQWRFTPAMANGQPVEIWINVDMDFRLY
jgi:TonB family protein